MSLDMRMNERADDVYETTGSLGNTEIEQLCDLVWERLKHGAGGGGHRKAGGLRTERRGTTRSGGWRTIKCPPEMKSRGKW